MGKNIRLLDPVRFVAALAVVLFHYTGHDFHTSLAPVSRFGFLGVPLFFIISGLVIAMSVSGTASPLQFVVRRATRLYPAFIICSLVTLAYVAIVPGAPQFSAYDIAVNMTMFGEMLHGRLINAAYWSLAVEWVFYFLMFGVVWIVDRKNLPIFLWCWLVASALSIICNLGFVGRLLVLHSAPFFVAGVSIYLMSSGDGSRNLKLLCLASLPVAIFWEIGKAAEAHVSGRFESAVVACVVVACYAVIAAIAHLPRTKDRGPLISQIAGRASYPLYLVHETIGDNILHRFYTPGFGGALLIFCLVVAMIFVACVISEFIETPIINRLKRLSVSGRSPAASA